MTLFGHGAVLEAQVLHQQLQQALNSRAVIEQAKGMVAERARLSMDQALSALRAYARNHNLRLADVAEAVISGSLASSAPGPVPARGRRHGKHAPKERANFILCDWVRGPQAHSA